MDQFTPRELTRLMDYFAQALDPDEMALVERWIAERADRRQFVEDLRRSRIDLGVDSSVAPWNLPSRVDAVAQTLSGVWSERSQYQSSASSAAAVSPSQRSDMKYRGTDVRVKSSRAPWYTMGTILASALFLLVGWQMGQRGNASTSVTMSTYTTGAGERATVALPDGSTILLNVGSRLQVPTNYSESNRTIQLTGQAMFTVVPLPGVPFTVVSGPSVTRVLGTRFSVRHYESDSVATVAVREGKVSVGTTVLTANEAMAVSAHGATRMSVAENQQFGFAQGILEVNDENFITVIPELNRWYNVDIRLGDSALVQQRVWGMFEAGSITDLVSILEFTFHVRVERNGRVLTLYRGQ